MKRLELKNKFSCKTTTKSTGPSFYRNGRAACPHRSLIAVVRNNSLTRQKKKLGKASLWLFHKGLSIEAHLLQFDIFQSLR